MSTCIQANMTYSLHRFCAIFVIFYLVFTQLSVTGTLFDPYQHNTTRPQSVTGNDFIRLDPNSWWYHLVYDDGYIRRVLDERYPYLKRPNNSYIGFRDYFNFEQVFWPTGDHLAKINLEQHIYDEQRAFDLLTVQTSSDIWLYSNQHELALSGGLKKDDDKCQRDFDRLYNEVELAKKDSNRLFRKGATNMELLRWIDSWGRPVSETYYGNSYWVGSHRGCKFAQVDLERESGTPGSPIKFNYCWAKLAAKDWPKNDVMRPKMSLRVGVCVPESCDTIQANKFRDKILRMLKFNFSPMHRKRFNRILDVYCLPQKELAFSSVENMPRELRWFLLVTSSWLSLILAASLHHHLFGRAHEEASKASGSWLKALTIQENLRLFLRADAPSQESRVDLRALGLIKISACLMVAFAHCFLQSYWNHHATTIMLYECRRLHYHAVQFTWKTLEIFLVITGMLTSYFIMAKFPGDRIKQLLKPQNFILLQVIRYARLAPVMAFACAFMKAVFIHLSDGPFWDYGTWKISPQGACQTVSWWRLLIWPIILDYQGAGGSPYQHECIPSSWYVVTELKIYLIIPFYVYALVSWRRARVPLIVATLTLSTFFKYLQLQAQQLAHYDQFFKYGEMATHNLFIVSLESAYFTVLDRFHAMAIGLFAGLYLYQYKTGEIKRWPFWMRRIFPLIFAAWQVYDLWFRTRVNEIKFRETGEIPSDTYIKSWLIFKPRLDAIMVALLSLRLATDWAKPVMRYSMTIYRLSKLTYCVYMVHTPVIMFVTTAHERTKPDTVPLQLMMMAAFIAIISFAIALPFYLLVESPFTLLIDHTLAKYKNSRAAEPQPTSSPTSSSSSSSSVSAPSGNKTNLSDKPSKIMRSGKSR